MASPLPKEDLQHILDHTRDLWEELRGQRLFITGGTGFFGCWLVESFAFANDQLRLGARASVLTRNPGAFQKKATHLAAHPAINLVKGDVRDFVFPAGEFSHVIHAATTSSAPVPPLEMLDTIIVGTRHTLDFAVACSAKKLLFTSSGAVYGRQPPDMTHIVETYTGAPDPCDPNSAYGEGKRVAELLCTIYRKEHGIETKIARCFAFAGPHLALDAHFAIGNFIRDTLNGGPIKVNGDGTPFRSYLYAADLAVWLWTILFDGTACWPYNVGSEAAITITDLARLVAQCSPQTVSLEIAREPAPGRDAERYVPSTQKARSALGVRETFDLAQVIERTILWNQQ